MAIIIKKDGTVEPFNLKLLRQTKWNLMAPTRDRTEEADEYDGEIDFGAEFQSQSLELHCITEEGLSIEEKHQKKVEIADTLNNLRDGDWLMVEHVPDKKIFAHFAGRVQIEEYPSWLRVTVPLRLDPFWVSAEENEFTGNSGTIENAGTFETPVIVEILAESGNVENPSITIGEEEIKYNGTIDKEGLLKIDAEKMTAALDGRFSLNYTESGEDFEEGELDGVVAGEDGLELEMSMGKALSFDGVEDANVNLGTAYTNLSGAKTIEFWCKPELGALNENNMFFGVQNVANPTGGIRFFCDDNNNGSKLRLRLYSPVSDVVTGLTTNNVFSYGVSQHIALVDSGSKVKVYKNGQFIEELNITMDFSVLTGTKEFTIAFGYHSSGSRRYKGIIDDFRIWNVERTQQQIQNNMSKELTGNETGLIGYWKFNEGGGSVAYDSTGNENHGTINGNPTWVDGLVGAYLEQGSRISLPLDLSSVGTVKTSEISWQATTPTDTNVKVETSLSTDGVTYGTWQQATNGQAIPGITANMDLSTAKLKIRATLATTDTSVTPLLTYLRAKTTSANIWENVNALANYEGSFPKLPPGETDVSVTAESGDPAVTFKWHDRWI